MHQQGRADLTHFIARCRAAFPDFVTARFNDAVGRYEIITKSTVGREVSQFFGWFNNPMTGAPIAPHEVTGLLPFREFDTDAQGEVFRAMQATGIDNRHDGKGTHRADQAARREKNRILTAARLRARVETIANVVKEVDLRRPWVKFHPNQRDPRARRLRATTAPGRRSGV